MDKKRLLAVVVGNNDVGRYVGQECQVQPVNGHKTLLVFEDGEAKLVNNNEIVTSCEHPDRQAFFKSPDGKTTMCGECFFVNSKALMQYWESTRRDNH